MDAWRAFNPPTEQWANLPSFLIGEHVLIALAAVALWHAWRAGRAHRVCWLAALVAGTANDLIFMALPLVDNFWHAQATWMLTPRLPLYIPCLYVCFLYVPTVAVWRAMLPPLPRAALTGLLAILFYAPFDIVGAKFLWWTWHDTDVPIAQRLLGAPMGSSMWVITFAAAFAGLLGRALDRDPAVARGTLLRAFGWTALLTTPVMMVQMTALQLLDGGAPGPVGLALLVALFAGVAWRGWRHPGRPEQEARDRILFVGTLVHFGALIVIALAFDPATHVSTGVHQTYGPCDVEARDIAGFTRRVYVCAEAFDEDYRFDCGAPAPADGARWYTVCGRPHERFASWLVGVVAPGLFGGALFWILLVGQIRDP
ncbi:MAG: DUF7802 domain-containing protein [Planctomycetota bacterium]|jgi:hypothetical protein